MRDVEEQKKKYSRLWKKKRNG